MINDCEGEVPDEIELSEQESRSEFPLQGHWSLLEVRISIYEDRASHTHLVSIL